jgi:propanediol dehydratase small subunit
MNTDAIESMVRDVLSRMNSLQDGITPAPAAPTNDTVRQPKVSDYPLATRHPEWVKTATNKTLDDLTLENVLSDRVTAQDMRITRKRCVCRRRSPRCRTRSAGDEL